METTPATSSLVTCQKDSYLRSLQTVLVAQQENNLKGEDARPTAGGFLVELADTVLFPEGGGQPPDHGTINGVKVVDVFRTKEGKVLHQVMEQVSAAASEPVDVQVDWARRFDHMQQHTAQHLLSALASQHFSANTASWQLGKDYCTIDFAIADLSQSQMDELEEMANSEIRENKKVIYHEIRGEAERQALPESVRSRGLPTDIDVIRLVEIEGIDMNTCCGTHVKGLSQLQMIKFIGKEKKKGITRVTFIAGGRVAREVAKWVDREKKLNTILQTFPDEHPLAATRIVGDVKTLNTQNKNLLKELAAFIGKELAATAAQQKLIDLHRDDADMGFLQSVVKVVTDETPAPAKDSLVLFLTCGGVGNSEGQFLLVGPKEFTQAVGKEVAALLEGKGGGRPGTFQGKCASLKKRKEVVDLLHAKLN